VSRAKEVTRVLADRRTTFAVITTLEASPLHEAEFFMQALQARKLQLGALVLNKVLPAYLRDDEATEAAEVLRSENTDLAAELAPLVNAPQARVAGVLAEVAASFANFRVVAQREAEQRAELSVTPEVTVAVPYLDADIHDLGGLLQLGERLWR
jgi:anion-transporting  ArsA/GET3 family ATPase